MDPGVFAMRCGADFPVASATKSAALADPPEDEIARDWSTWAHKVKVGQSSQKQRSFVECDRAMETWA